MIIIVLLLILLLAYVYLFYYWHKSLKIEVFDEDKSIDLVIARYEENLDFFDKLDLDKFRRILIYNKGSDLPIPSLLENYNYEIIKLANVGRCDHTYLYHIVNNYDNLATTTIFLPGSCSMDYKWKNALKTVNLAINTNKSVFIGKKKDDVLKNEYNFALDKWRASNQQNSSKNAEDVLILCPERPFGKWYEKNFGNIHINTVVYFGIFAASKEDIQHRSFNSYKNLIKYVDHHSNPEAGHYFERAWLAVFHPVSQDCIYNQN